MVTTFLRHLQRGGQSFGEDRLIDPRLPQGDQDEDQHQRLTGDADDPPGGAVCAELVHQQRDRDVASGLVEVGAPGEDAPDQQGRADLDDPGRVHLEEHAAGNGDRVGGHEQTQEQGGEDDLHVPQAAVERGKTVDESFQGLPHSILRPTLRRACAEKTSACARDGGIHETAARCAETPASDTRAFLVVHGGRLARPAFRCEAAGIIHHRHSPPARRANASRWRRVPLRLVARNAALRTRTSPPRSTPNEWIPVFPMLQLQSRRTFESQIPCVHTQAADMHRRFKSRHE